MRRLILALTLAGGVAAPFLAEAATASMPATQPAIAGNTQMAADPDVQFLQARLRQLEIRLSNVEQQQQQDGAYDLAQIENLPSGG